MIFNSMGKNSRFFGWLLNKGQFDFRFSGRILEVGVGHERLCPYSVTVDSDPATNPDLVCNIQEMPFEDKEFDLCIAHEVFCVYDKKEQIKILREIQRVSRACYLRQWKWCLWC